ncbi:MAG: hypothetical protein AAFY60_17210 [Myxococcota bacterium]
MPIGTLKVKNTYVQSEAGKVHCTRTMNVSGWLLIALFKLHYEKATRCDMHETWFALEERAKSAA